MARQSLVTNPWNTRTSTTTRQACWSEMTSRTRAHAFWLRRNARQHTSTSESLTSDRRSRGRRWRSPLSPLWALGIEARSRALLAARPSRGCWLWVQLKVAGANPKLTGLLGRPRKAERAVVPSGSIEVGAAKDSWGYRTRIGATTRSRPRRRLTSSFGSDTHHETVC
jgi:hypothetical protein